MATVQSQEVAREDDEYTKPPFLRRVRIRGYKSIVSCDVPLQPLTILVGRNAAGKSNFLDALAFLRDVLDTSATEAVKRHGGWSSILCRTASTPVISIEIETGFTCGRPFQRLRAKTVENIALSEGEPIPNLEGLTFTARYLLEVASGVQGIVTIVREKLDLLDETGKLVGGFDLRRGLSEVSQGPDGEKKDRLTGGLILNHLSSTLIWCSSPHWPAPSWPGTNASSLHRSDHALLGALGFQPFIDLGDALRWMGFYNIHPDAVRGLQKPLPGVLLERDGRNLASVINGLAEIDPASLQRAQEYLCDIVEEVRQFETITYGEYETVRFHLHSENGGKPLELDAASMSDGTLRVLCHILAAFQIVLPHGYASVIGIEEPETALHPAALRALVDALREATQHTQILLTTHSPDLLMDRYLDLAQVLVVRNHGGQTQLAPVDPASREIVRKELYTLADLQRMDHLEPDAEDLTRQARTMTGNEEE